MATELLIDAQRVLTLCPAAAHEPTGPTAILVEAGLVTAVGPAEELRAAHPGAVRHDAGDRWLMPGLRNAHGHLAGWNREGPLEAYLLDRHALADDDAVRRRARQTAAALVRGGVTWTHVLHYGGRDQAAVAGLRDVGLRVQLCPGVLDRYSVLPYDEGDAQLRAALPEIGRAHV